MHLETTYGLAPITDSKKLKKAQKIIDGIWMQPNCTENFHICGSFMAKGFCFFSKEGIVLVNQQPQNPQQLKNFIFKYENFRVCKVVDEKTLHLHCIQELQPLICVFDSSKIVDEEVARRLKHFHPFFRTAANDCVSNKQHYNQNDIQDEVFIPEHNYDIYFLSQRLYCRKKKYYLLTKILGLNHVGLGFIDKQTEEEYVVEYTYNQDFSPFNYSYLPNIMFNIKEKAFQFQYVRTHSVRVQNKIEHKKCTWEHTQLIAKDVQGQILRLWIREYVIPFSNTIGKNYKLHTVKARWTQDIVIDSCNCQDFVWWSIQYMQHKLDVNFLRVFETRNYGIQYIDNVKKHVYKLDINNPWDLQLIDDYQNGRLPKRYKLIINNAEDVYIIKTSWLMPKMFMHRVERLPGID